MDFPGGSDGKVSCLQCGRPGFDPCVGKILWRRKWQPPPVLFPWKSHGLRSLVGYSPWGPKELDTTEWLHFLSLWAWVEFYQFCLSYQKSLCFIDLFYCLFGFYFISSLIFIISFLLLTLDFVCSSFLMPLDSRLGSLFEISPISWGRPVSL